MINYIENKKLEEIKEYVLRDEEFIEKNKWNLEIFWEKIKFLEKALDKLFLEQEKKLKLIKVEEKISLTYKENLLKFYDEIRESLIKEFWEKDIPKRFDEIFYKNKNELEEKIDRKLVKFSIFDKIKEILNIKK